MLTVTTNHRFGSARLTEARELICADVGLSGTTANSEKRPFWKLLARADAVIE
jgi:hypothetical protein